MKFVSRKGMASQKQKRPVGLAFFAFAGWRNLQDNWEVDSIF